MMIYEYLSGWWDSEQIFKDENEYLILLDKTINFTKLWRKTMETPKKKTTVFMLVAALSTWLMISCDDANNDKNRKYDKLADLYGRSMIYNSLGRFMMAGNYSEIQNGGELNYWYFMPGMMMMGFGNGTVSNDGISQDTAFYDPVTGYWTYSYSDSNFAMSMRYKFTPRDSNGYPTAETDAYVFESSYTGNWNDEWFNMSYTYNGQSDFQISGLRNWMDSAIIGELVYSGNSVSNSTQIFSADTTVAYGYTETMNNIRMRENHCIPYTGTISFRMTQDATPDSFTWDPGWTYRGLDNGFTYTDFDFNGQMIYVNNGIRWIIDGEKYFWEVDCDELWLGAAGANNGGLRKR